MSHTIVYSAFWFHGDLQIKISENKNIYVNFLNASKLRIHYGFHNQVMN